MLALSPLLVFLATYMVSSIAAGDFYKVPVSAAFLLASIYAIAITPGQLGRRIETFSAGAGNSNVLTMVWIFILAGAFAGTAKDIGAVDATVNAALRIIPPRMIFAGLFLTACFISMAVGTSVGTIVALVPIASGIAVQGGIELPYMAAIIVGGALFGDNLSFISDTTIAATRAMGCEMRDKFKVNIQIILPAVLIVTAIYLIQGQDAGVIAAPDSIQWYKLIPYILIIAMALAGCNVMLILSTGIAVNAAIGAVCGAFTWTGWLGSVGRGIAGMNDLIVVTLLAGGLLEIIRSNGGLTWITESLTRRIDGKRGAQFSIAAMVALSNFCTANNTIAIITCGGIAKDITDRYGIDPRKTASILDTFSCLIQGIIPYGAQILMAAGLAGCAPSAILPHLYYPVLMGLCAILAIVFRLPRKYSL